jgi:glycosyltransferase involved in cell wall biosynthesis
MVDAPVTARLLGTHVNEPGGDRFACVTYFASSYTGRGPGYSCVSILAAFPGAGAQTLLLLPRARRPVPVGVERREALRWPVRKLPWPVAERFATAAMAREFRRVAHQAESDKRIAYFWPGVPVEVVRLARAEGFVTVREMINSFRGSAKRVLDAEYRRIGLEPQHGISSASVAEEQEELVEYDYVFASNPLVEVSLGEAGVAPERVLSTSFGWSAERYPETARHEAARCSTGFEALYVGTACVRKGAHLLLDAWEACGLSGTLTLAGDVEPVLAPQVEAAVASGRVRHLPYVTDINRLYRSADVFVFPTLEEGGPQVTYEAAGCGLPVVTTPAGAARLIVDGENGHVVAPASVEALVDAMTRLAADPGSRHRLGAAAADGARRFDYRSVGRQRADAMRRALATASPSLI